MRRLSWWKTACAAVVLCTAAAIALPAQTFTVLGSFDGTDGGGPFAGLIQRTDGNLYGTAYYGGSNSKGTIFRITSAGALVTVYSFCSQSGCTDGAGPDAPVIEARDGNLYGTTYSGGAQGGGTIFKVSRAGSLTTLYSFCSQSTCADGAGPESGLLQTSDGNLYGTTSAGGNASGAGTIFRVSPQGAFDVLYSFCSQTSCADGQLPAAGLIQARDGSFYGTTTRGGANGSGTVFKITAGGALTTLYSFDYGANPVAGLVQASDGNFYGTTYNGGAWYEGTVFKVTPGGTLTTLYSFNRTDGENPAGGLIQATNGDFYGTTQYGGGYGDGTIFEISPSGAFKTLHRFDERYGAMPTGNLVQTTDGSFSGTTGYGGTYKDGTVFRLSVGLQPFVETEPTSGRVGAQVKILGTSLTGATTVTFNGTAATFMVVSPSLITTTVPAGATTGIVQVATPGGTLSSNVPFRVME